MNWAGFYVLDLSDPSQCQLILGPFHGKVACQTIAFGRGVCGTAAQSQQAQLVPDVAKYPDHIACDGHSRSEIVVPVLRDGKVTPDQRICPPKRELLTEYMKDRGHHRHRLRSGEWL